MPMTETISKTIAANGTISKADDFANILEVRDLSVKFHKGSKTGTALDNISLDIPKGKIIGLVGESGCGKTVLGSTIIGLLPERGAEITSGSIRFNDPENSRSVDLLDLNYHGMKKYRGSRISMIFQEPMSSLNPIYTIGSQIAETIKNQDRALSAATVRQKTVDILSDVGMPDPSSVHDLYPHQLSGGMRQRVVIAIAVANNPDIIIADEPTTALDITISEQILHLLYKIRDKYNSSIVLITHDLGVVANICDEVYVMYRGSIFEHGSASEVFAGPRNPYTVGLMQALPEFVRHKDRLHVIAGNVPSIFSKTEGCKFFDRCVKAQDICKKESPAIKYSGAKHYYRCHF